MRKTVLLILIVIVLFGIMYNLNWKKKVDLYSLRNSSSKTVKDLLNEYGAGYAVKLTDGLIDKMTLDEKIGQLIFTGIKGTTLTEEMEVLINEYKVGGIIFFANNLKTPEQSVRLLNQIKIKNEQNMLPLFLGVDQEGGRVERLPDLVKLPTNEEIGIENNERFSYEIGGLLGKQLNTFGFNLNFAPVLDVNSNPDNPVIGDRAFGNDFKTVSKLGIQTIKGMKAQHIIPVVKHFPGHGDTDVDSHVELPLVDKSLAELEALELVPFKKAIETGVEAIMTAHILLPQIDDELPASMSGKVITGILRDELAFDGVVITDDMTMQAIKGNFDVGDAAVKSVKAGTDIILIAHDFDGLISVYENLRKAVEKGEISEERIDESIQRIMKLKLQYELEDKQVDDIHIKELNELIHQVLHE